MRLWVFSLATLLLFAVPAEAQYVVAIPEIDTYSGYPSVSNTYFFIPRPDVGYQSVRLRGLSEGLRGLIRDSYTDHFRNPAYRANDSLEFMGDLGSVEDHGKFLFGGTFPLKGNTLAGFVNLERLMKMKSSSEYDRSTPYGPPSTGSSATEYSPRTIGGRLANNLKGQDDITIGFSYEFSNPKLADRQEYVQKNQPYSIDHSFLHDHSSDGNIHRISTGILKNLGDAQLELSAIGTFTKYRMSERYEDTYHSPSYIQQILSVYPTEVRTNGFLFAAGYQRATEEGGLNRFLIQIGRTKYDASGSSRYESRYTYGPLITRNTSRETNGTIIDLKAGAGFERKISGSITTYFGFSVNYVRNKATGSENGAGRDSTFSYDSTTTLTRSLSDTKKGLDFRIPVGVEYYVSEYAILRGGLEPRYRSGETTVEERDSYRYPYSGLSNTRLEVSGLSLAVNCGATFHHNDYGRFDLLLGDILTQTRFWAVAIRYYI